MITKLVVLSNAVSFFGKDLAKDEQFMISALAYIEETLLCAEAVRLLPGFLTPYVIPCDPVATLLTFVSIVGGIITRSIHSHKVIFNRLLPIAEQRCLERDLANLGQTVPKHVRAPCIRCSSCSS